MLRSFLSSLVAVVVLTGCLDYEEVMILNPDLSGNAELTVTLPEGISGKYAELQNLFSVDKAKTTLEKVKGVKLDFYEKGTGLRPTIKMRLSFESLEAWNQISSAHPQSSVLLGKFNWRKEQGNWVIERQLGLAADGTEVSADNLPEFNYVLYTTKFARPIVSTNSKQYNNHGQEVRYRLQLRQVLDEKTIMTTSVQAPSPWLRIIGGAVAAMVILWWIWGWFQKNAKLKQAKAG